MADDAKKKAACQPSVSLSSMREEVKSSFFRELLEQFIEQNTPEIRVVLDAKSIENGVENQVRIAGQLHMYVRKSDDSPWCESDTALPAVDSASVRIPRRVAKLVADLLSEHSDFLTSEDNANMCNEHATEIADLDKVAARLNEEAQYEGEGE